MENVTSNETPESSSTRTKIRKTVNYAFGAACAALLVKAGYDKVRELKSDAA